MLQKLNALDLRFASIEAQLGAGETYEDPALVAKLNKEQRELETVVTAYRAYLRRKQDLADAEEAVSSAAIDLFSAYNTYRWAVEHGILN